MEKLYKRKFLYNQDFNIEAFNKYKLYPFSLPYTYFYFVNNKNEIYKISQEHLFKIDISNILSLYKRWVMSVKDENDSLVYIDFGEKLYYSLKEQNTKVPFSVENDNLCLKLVEISHEKEQIQFDENLNIETFDQSVWIIETK